MRPSACAWLRTKDAAWILCFSCGWWLLMLYLPLDFAGGLFLATLGCAVLTGAAACVLGCSERRAKAQDRRRRRHAARHREV